VCCCIFANGCKAAMRLRNLRDARSATVSLA
jgi:hypothetical protein